MAEYDTDEQEAPPQQQQGGMPPLQPGQTRLQRFRAANNGAYDKYDDGTVLGALYQKHYSDQLPFDHFVSQMTTPAPKPTVKVQPLEIDPTTGAPMLIPPPPPKPAPSWRAQMPGGDAPRMLQEQQPSEEILPETKPAPLQWSWQMPGDTTPRMIPAPEETRTPSGPWPQTRAGAAWRAGVAGGVEQTAETVRGVGEAQRAAERQTGQNMLSTYDQIDAGKPPPKGPYGAPFWQEAYEQATPDQRKTMREQAQGVLARAQDPKPYALETAGTGMDEWSKHALPVDPRQEGQLTRTVRGLGGLAVMIPTIGAATFLGGPGGGALAGSMLVGAQSFDNSLQQALKQGLPRDQAESYAFKDAAVQGAIMATPLGRVIQSVPMPLRDGLTKTLLNLGRHGLEFAGFNAASQFAHNYVTQQTIDPNQKLTDGVMDAGLEGLIQGMVVPVAMGAPRMVRGAFQQARAVLAPAASPEFRTAQNTMETIARTGVAPPGAETVPTLGAGTTVPPEARPPAATPPAAPTTAHEAVAQAQATGKDVPFGTEGLVARPDGGITTPGGGFRRPPPPPSRTTAELEKFGAGETPPAKPPERPGPEAPPVQENIPDRGVPRLAAEPAPKTQAQLDLEARLRSSEQLLQESQKARAETPAPVVEPPREEVPPAATEPPPTRPTPGEPAVKTIPEPAHDIAAQLAELHNPQSTRDAVFIPVGTKMPEGAGRGLISARRPEGVLLTNSQEKADAFKALPQVTDDAMAKILGHPESKTDVMAAAAEGKPANVVQAVDKQGNVAAETAATQEGTPAAQDAVQQQAPGSTVRTVTPEEAATRRTEEMAKEEPAAPTAPAAYGSENKMFTQSMAEAARARLRAKMGQLNTGFDPEMMLDGMTLAGYHIEAGARKFADFARAMLGDLGEGIRPYLEHLYNSVRDYPGFEPAGMEDRETVAQQFRETPGGEGPEAGPVDQRGEPETLPAGGGAGGPEGEGTPGALAPRPPEDVPGAGAGTPEEAGVRPEREEVPGGEAVPGGGDAATGRGAGGGEGVDAAGAGTRERTPEPVAFRPNFHIDDPESLIGGSPKVRFARNRAALQALQAIEEEQRPPTPEELKAMAGYIGWGSFGQDLFQGTFERAVPRRGWDEEAQWLRQHLGKEAWESAQRSIINAHYTDPPTVLAMWDMARAMGFKGGRTLEPSMGIGNFFGMMPRDIMAASDLTGIELDHTTARMAALLYPEAGVHQKGYQESRTPDNFYDFVIGNWPFAAQAPADRRYAKLEPTLHDYFFLKALDQTRPGGLVMGITSAGTMDKTNRSTRIELAKKGELVAAFRLPTGAFEQYAGTSVVTDMLVFRKREAPPADPTAEPWVNTSEIGTPSGGTIRVNDFFRDNPDNVLGTLDWGHGTTRGQPGMIVHRPDDLMERLQTLASRVPADAYQPRAARGSEPRFITNNSGDRQQSVTIGPDGHLYQVQGERLVRMDDLARQLKGGKPADRTRAEAQVRAMVGLRRAYGALIDAERDGAPHTEDLRQELARQFTAFRAEHGTIKDSVGWKILNKHGDPAASQLAALERPDGTPSRILTEPTVRARRSLENPTVPESYVLARNEAKTLDMDRIAELAKQPRDVVERELLGSGAVYRTPGGGFEAADLYLGGNVRRKLREAQDAVQRGEDMQASVDALTKVLPTTVPYFQIEAKLGAPWVADRIYKDFIGHMLGLSDEQKQDVQVRFAGARWRVTFSDPRLRHRMEATTNFGTDVYRFDKLVAAAMGNTTIKIMTKDIDGNDVWDKEASDEANGKVQAMREAFSDWAWADPERRMQLETSYNETMNAIAKPRFDGSFMDMSGMALRRGDDPFSLRQHQQNAIWRGVATGRGLFAHEVGTGKSYTMAGVAIEGRRYGVHSKPLVFAHNANSEAVATEFRQMYPGANVLYVDKLKPETINRTLHSIANEDWDAIVMPHSLINRMALSRETLMDLARDQITALENEAMEAAQEDGHRLTPEMMDDPEAMRRLRSPTAKELVRQRERIFANIEAQAQRASREGAVAFENLGVDAIIVDEAHEFKKPPIATRMNLRGLQKETSDKSVGLNFLTGYVKKQNNGKGTYLFTGTPVTNALNEVFNMGRYFMDDVMAKDGIADWDAWFNTFADATEDVEVTAAGTIEPVKRLAAFNNIDELVRQMSEFTDVVQSRDMPEFKPRSTPAVPSTMDQPALYTPEPVLRRTLSSPDLTDAERDQLTNGRQEKPQGLPYKKIIRDVGEMSPAQKEILAYQRQLATEWKQASGRQRLEWRRSGDEHSPILVEQNVPNASLDARLYDPDAPDDPGSKIHRVTANVLKHYAEPNSSQVIFVDRGYGPTKSSEGRAERFVLVNDLIAKLVAGGIPRSEIEVVAGKMEADRKSEIADQMNDGRTRVVIGQSGTLGVGVNMQRQLRAMHHMDAPWMPGELEQRNGRGERQGNTWNTVLEYRYVTEGIDGRRWQVLAAKDGFIKKFISAFNDTSGKRLGSLEGDAASIEDEKDADILKTLGEATGDPRIMIREKLRADVNRLERRERQHTMGVADARKRARDMRQMLVEQTNKRAVEALHLANWDAAAGRADAVAKAAGDTRRTYETDIGGEHPLHGEEIQAALDKQTLQLAKGERQQVLGTINGHQIIADWPGGNPEPYYRMASGHGQAEHTLLAAPTMQRIISAITALRSRATAGPSDFERRVQSLEQAGQAEFTQKDQLATKRDQLRALEADMQANPEPAPAWLRHGAPVDTDIHVDGQPRTVRGHSVDDDYRLVTDEGPVSYLDAKDASGQRIFDVHPPPEVAGEEEEGKPSLRPGGTAERPAAAAGSQLSDLMKGVMRYAGLPERIGLKLVDKLKDAATGKSADAVMTKDLLTFALDTPPDQVPQKLFHEIIHGLMDQVLDDRSRKALEVAADRYLANKRNRAELEGLYGTDPQRLREEAAARLAERALQKARDPGSLISRAAHAMSRAVQGLGQAMRDEGYTTADHVFRSIMQGEHAPEEARLALEQHSVPDWIAGAMAAQRTASGELTAEGKAALRAPPITGTPTLLDRIRAIPRIGEHLGAIADLAASASDAVKMAVAPMAVGARQAKAMAKDWANLMTLARHEGAAHVRYLTGNFTPAQRREMWEAADVESVHRQMGSQPPAGAGLDSLPPDQRAIVEHYQQLADRVFQQARRLGMTDAPGLPSYMARMIADFGEPGAHLVRDVAVLPLATMRLQQAIAGRRLINGVKQAGAAVGETTMQEGGVRMRGSPLNPFGADVTRFAPSLRQRKYLTSEQTEAAAQRHITDDDGVKWFTIPENSSFWTTRYGGQDANGEAILRRVPIYVRSDFEGPLRSIMAGREGVPYRALMDLKGRLMTGILYGVTHLGVVAFRALPASDYGVRLIKLGMDGHAGRNDPDTMNRLIMGGLRPISRDFGFQDLSSIERLPNIAPGRSWTSQIAGLVLGRPFGKDAQESVKGYVDRVGDFVHGTLLWDRVADIQVGLALRHEAEALHKGADPGSATRLGANLANMYTGALPREAMSDAARKVANVVLFSRSYRIAGLAALKSAIVGLPQDVRAQIERDQGTQAMLRMNSMQRRASWGILATDMAMYMAGLSVMQSAANVLLGVRQGSDEKDPHYWNRVLGRLGPEAYGYVQRAQDDMNHVWQHPTSVLNPFDLVKRLLPTYEHEPGKENRILLGYARDGTGIYMRPTFGKSMEDVLDYFTQTYSTAFNILSPFARPAVAVLKNQTSPGKAMFDAYGGDWQDQTGQFLGNLVKSTVSGATPSTATTALWNLVTGQGTGMDVAKIAGGGLGFSFSQGFPGGPAAGERYAINQSFSYRERAAMPGIRDMIKRGDVAGAREAMGQLRIAPRLQNFIIRETTHPFMTPRQVQRSLGHATPEEAQRFRQLQMAPAGP